MSVRVKIEDGRDGLVATISQRDDMGKVIGHPTVFLVASKEEAKQHAKSLARSLGLKVYGIVDKTDAGGLQSLPTHNRAEAASPDPDDTTATKAQPPWAVPGVGRYL